MSPAVGILGRLLVRRNEAAADLDALREREIQLLALLAIRHGHVVPTEEIAELLFGHLAEDRAVANVRVSVSRLRKTLGDGDLIVSARHGYQLAKDCEVDVELFEERVADGRAATVAGSFDRARSSFEVALALYRGDLAEGLRAEWIDGGRQRLRSLRSDVFDELADAYVALARPREAADVAERAISLEPTRESAYRRLMTARYAAGEQDAALAAYARCRQVLSDELGVDPLPETMRLHERIVRGEPIAVPGTHGSARTHRAFVARDPDRITLDATIARAASECVFALVLGEPGAGKTRLVDEVLRARSDVTVVATRCFALERDMPFQPLREALGDRAPSAESAEARGDLVARYARTLISEAHGRPLVWSIDDIQWADVSTIAVFHHVALRMPTAQVAIVATGRSEDLPPEHPVIATLTELRRQQRGERLALAPLSLEDVTALARAHHVGTEQARSIYTRSGGNAFFATELLALARRGDRSLPPTARDAVLARSHLLSADAQAALRAAAVLGGRFQAREVAEIASLEADPAARALGELETHELLAAPATPEFVLAHDLVREAVYDDIPAAVRSHLHGRAINAVDGARGAAGASLICYHAELAGDRECAFACALSEGERALAAHAGAEALANLDRALLHANELDATRRCLSLRAEAKRVLGLLAEAEADQAAAAALG